jgi:hypothetical protein
VFSCSVILRWLLRARWFFLVGVNLCWLSVMTNADTPNLRTYAEGDPIPPVALEDIKRCWHLKPPWRPGNDHQSACSAGADVAAVYRRWRMINTLTTLELLTPWQHAEELDDAVFRVGASFPLHAIAYKRYKIPGDELYGFDPNAFVQQLIVETGISHVWESVRTKIPEGGRCFGTSRILSRVPNPGERVPPTEREAKSQARQVLWDIWKRFSPSLDQLLAASDKEEAAHTVATFFANFLLDNVGLVRQLEDAFRDLGSVTLDPILSELERKAATLPW